MVLYAQIVPRINFPQLCCLRRTRQNPFKEEVGELQIYFRKIPQHKQKFLVIYVLYYSSWLPKKCPK